MTAHASPVATRAVSARALGALADEPVEFLDLDDVVGLAIALLGDPAPIRDVGLLGSAVARPQTTAFGEDAYPDIWTKAAALLHSIIKNHALVDGNKRLGWLATAVFLEINGVEISRASNDDGVRGEHRQIDAVDSQSPSVAVSRALRVVVAFAAAARSARVRS